MLTIVIGIVMSLLIALDLRRVVRSGVASTLFGTYPKQSRPKAFTIVCGLLALMSLTLLALSAVLLARELS